MSTERENITFKNGGFLCFTVAIGLSYCFFSLHLFSAVVTNDIIINVFSLELIIICISFCWIIIVILTFLLS